MCQLDCRHNAAGPSHQANPELIEPKEPTEPIEQHLLNLLNFLNPLNPFEISKTETLLQWIILVHQKRVLAGNPCASFDLGNQRRHLAD